MPFLLPMPWSAALGSRMLYGFLYTHLHKHAQLLRIAIFNSVRSKALRP